jgi:hypothetical protein
MKKEKEKEKEKEKKKKKAHTFQQEKNYVDNLPTP